MVSQFEPPYIRTEFQLEAVFKHRRGGETKFKDVVGMAATFALNTIPTATLDVPTGLEVRTEEKATIHDALKQLEPRDRCLVYLTIKSTDGYLDEPITHGMKDGKILVFDGYYAGIGYSRSSNHCTYTIHLIHWLDDLNCSSMLNGDWSPGVPHDLTQMASHLVVSDLTGGGGAQAVGDRPTGGQGVRATPAIDNAYPEVNGKTLVTTTNMEQDLWDRVIKKIFWAIAKLRHPRLQCRLPVAAVDDPPPTPPPGAEEADSAYVPRDNNEAALIALKRMPGKVPAQYRAKLPLNLKGFDDGEPFVQLSLCAHNGLCRMIMEGMGQNSFWSKLVGELAPSFLFAVSPSVEFAQAIPFFPGLNTPHVTITGEEYNYANFNVNCARMVSCIAMHWPPQGEGGSQFTHGGRLGAKHSYCSTVGKYPKNADDYSHHWGNILVRQPPPWLAYPVYKEAYARENHFNYQRRSACRPQQGSEENPEAPDTHRTVEKTFLEKKDDVDGEQLNIYDRFAAHFYKSTILGQRHGELSGKLRFDIAPGSIVKIEPPITEIGQSNAPLYGAVVSVSFVINAEQHQAGTSFTLSHMRTEEENNVSNRDSRVHYVGTVAPIYKKEEPGSPWPGGPLAIQATAPTDFGAPAFNPGNVSNLG